MKVIESPAYRELSLWGRAVLIELVACFNGYNNGKIVCTFDQLSERLGNTNRRAMSKAFAELMEHGFIDVTCDADWLGRRGREYRLTFVNTTPGCKFKAATNDYKDWVKPIPKAGKTSSPKKAIFGDDASLNELKTGDASSPVEATDTQETAEVRHSAIEQVGSTVSPLIDNHTPGSYWWACEGQLAVERLLCGLITLCHDVPNHEIAN